MINDVLAALQRIGDELAGIRAVLEVVAVQAAEPEPAADCQHPVESRVDFGLTGGEPDWQCGVCGYRSVKVGA